MTHPRILIYELRMMGDAIMSLPFVRAAVERYDVWIACSPSGSSVYRHVLPADRLICWDTPWNRESGKYGLHLLGRSGAADFVRRTRRVRPDVVVAGWADPRTHILMALAGARVRLGYLMNRKNYIAHETPWRRRQMHAGQVLYGLGSLLLARPLLNRHIDRQDYEQHHVEDWKQLADALGIPWRVDRPWLICAQAPASSRIEEFCDRMAAERRRILVVHAGARTRNRQWPADKFVAVAKAVAERYSLAVILVSSPEAVMADPAVPHMMVAAPADFDQLCAVVSRADVVLCNDSGVAHLGSALGKRVVAVFSSQNPHWFAPYGSEEWVAQVDVCPHRPCFNRCVMPSFICLDSVTPDRVMEKLERTLAELP